MGCGSSDDDRAVRIFKGAAIKEGVVSGFVVDDESELPVAAEVLVGGMAVRAQPDGSFQAAATAGRVRVEVRSEGYIKTFRDVVAGDKALPMPFKVAHRGPKVPMGAMGGDVPHRGATLVVAPGTFPLQTQIALTYLTPIRVAAIAAAPQFIDNTGIPRRAVALVDVDAEAMPMVGMRARVPVPMDAAMDSVSGFMIDGSGNWTTAVAPASVSGGVAEFVFNGNAQIGVAIDVRKAGGKKIGYLVTERGGSGKGQGDLLEGGAEIAAGGRATSIVDQHGSRIEMPPGTRARVEVPAGEMPATASRAAPYAGEVTVSAGRARAVVPPPAPGATKSIKLTLKGTAGKYSVTGTGLTLATCLNGTDFLDFLEVVEGQVEVEAGTDKEKKTETINAGESALVCTNCKAAPTPMCMEPPGPDGGTGPTPTPLDGSVGMMTIEGGVPIDGPPVVPGDASPADAVLAADTMATGGMGGGGGVGGVGGAGGTGGSPPPDAGAPDAAAPDAMLSPDTSAPTPDTAAPLPPDAAPPPADAAPPPPPDAAPPPPAAMLIISPTSHDFLAATVLTPGATHNFSVTNVGNLTSGPLLVQSMGEFGVIANGCTGNLAPGASCSVTMQFFPQGTGVRTGALTVSALPGGTATASLTGTGFPMGPPPPPPDAAPPEPDVAPPPPDMNPPPPDTNPPPPDASADAAVGLLEISPNIHHFWAAQNWHDPAPPAGAPGGFPFFVTNIGGASTTVVPTMMGKDPTNFSIVVDGCKDVTLAPGQNCQIRIQYDAPQLDTSNRSAILQVTDANQQTTTADLIGHTMESDLLRLEPAMHDFESSSEPSPRQFTVRNLTDPQGNGINFDLISFSIEDDANQVFSIATFGNTCQQGLAPGATCTMLVQFVNSQPGTLRSGVLRARGRIRSSEAPIGTATAQLFGGVPRT